MVKSNLRLHPAVAATRCAVRSALEPLSPKRILVAVSGGADSLALAAACAFVCKKLKIEYFGICIDHNLQEGSFAQAHKAAVQLFDLGFLDVYIEKVGVPKGNTGIENAARIARYAAIKQKMHEIGADYVCLGHTMDDQAETVLLGLLRGSGPRSLAGMRIHRGKLLRPFLGIKKHQTEGACLAQNLDYWQDPHNIDTKFTRALIRRAILPYLESKLGKKITCNLAKTALLFQEDLDFLDQTAASLEQSVYHTAKDELGEVLLLFYISELIDLHTALSSRIIKRTVLRFFNASLHYAHIQAINNLIYNWHGQKEVFLPKICIKRKKNLLIIQKFTCEINR